MRGKIIAVSLSIMLFLTCAQILRATDVQKVNINKAGVEELSQLEGIGSKYAERIVEFREKNGPFKQPEDVVKVPGIGSKIWEINKDKIAVE